MVGSYVFYYVAQPDAQNGMQYTYANVDKRALNLYACNPWQCAPQRRCVSFAAGHRLAYPVLIAPMAMQCMAHPDGELAVSRAAAGEGIPMVRSVPMPICITGSQSWWHVLVFDAIKNHTCCTIAMPTASQANI